MADYSKKFHKLGDKPHLHVGKLIGRALKLQRITQAEAARRIGVSTSTCSLYLRKSSLQFGIVWKISIALNYNLLGDLMDDLPDGVFKNTNASFLKTMAVQQQEIEDLKNKAIREKEMESLKSELKVYKDIFSNKN